MENVARLPSERFDPVAQPTGAAVLDMVRSLLLELHPERGATIAVDLDSDLEREFGLDSLGRAELILRLSRSFRVSLPERLIGEAATPAALLAAIQAAGAARETSTASPPPAALPTAAEPHRATTWADVLDFHVRNHPDRPHLRLQQEDGTETVLTYAVLDRRSRQVAAGLLKLGLAFGDRVALMLPTGPDFFPAFLGTILAGGVPDRY